MDAQSYDMHFRNKFFTHLVNFIFFHYFYEFFPIKNHKLIINPYYFFANIFIFSMKQ